MQAKYSQYDSDSFLQGYTTPIGGLNANAEFRPQAEKITTGAGLLISVKSDQSGTLYIEYTNIIKEPYSFIDEYVLDNSIINPMSSEDFLADKTYVVSVKATNFRIRFRNTGHRKQNIFKLFCFILPTNPVISINADTLPFQVDASGKLFVHSDLNDGYGNKINSIIDESVFTINHIRSLCTININDYKYNDILFNYTSTEIISNEINLGRYKNFDINFDVTATNYAPIRFYLYTRVLFENFAKTEYYIDIYYGDTTKTLSNITLNATNIKLIGNKISGLIINKCQIVRKG